jgi:hypothetical protein
VVRRTLVLLLLASPAPALAAGADGWRGKTAQGLGMELTVSKGGGLLERVGARYALSCSDDSSQVRGFGLSFKAGDVIAIDDDGRFGTSGTMASGLPGKGSGSATYWIRGRLTKARATGFLRIDFTLDSGVSCTSGKVAYSLR